MLNRWQVRKGYLAGWPVWSSNATDAGENANPAGMVHCRHRIAKRRNSAADATDASSGGRIRKSPCGSSPRRNSGDPDPGYKSAAVEHRLRQVCGIRQRFRTSSLIGLNETGESRGCESLSHSIWKKGTKVPPYGGCAVSGLLPDASGLSDGGEKRR